MAQSTNRTPHELRNKNNDNLPEIINKVKGSMPADMLTEEGDFIVDQD